jgi:HbrB-like
MSYGSSSTLVSLGPSNASGLLPAPEKDNTWGALHVHVLPLFNGDPLKFPIEDLNILVKKHMAAVVARNPSKAVPQLETDVSELITAGMVTLNSKLAAGVEEEKLAGRIVDLWGFFWDQVLPYVEGVCVFLFGRSAVTSSQVFLPLQTDPYLHSLSRPQKTLNSSSSSELGSGPNGAPSIDVRKLALRSFRDSVVLPVAPRLQKRFSAPNREKDLNSELADHHRPRLEQMLVLVVHDKGIWYKDPMLNHPTGFLCCPPSQRTLFPSPQLPKTPSQQPLANEP